MIRWFAVIGFAFLIGTSAQGMTPAPFAQSESMIMPIAAGCGPARTRINGVCVARTTIRHTRRAARRCLRWSGGACALYE
jgi:hypothetical protein